MTFCTFPETNYAHLTSEADNNVSEHATQTARPRPYACPACDKRFAQRGSLIIHQRAHSAEKPHECSSCGKRFVTEGRLQRHRARHDQERRTSGGESGDVDGGVSRRRRSQHACAECGKCFENKTLLTIHGRTHSGERPYACTVCDKRFTQQGHLSRHNRIHTGEKMHQCSLCGKVSHSCLPPSLVMKQMLLYVAHQMNACISTAQPADTSVAPHGPGAPAFSLYPLCPFTSSSFALFYFPPFLFSFALPIFFFCPSLPLFYESSPTLFPGRRS